MIYTDAQLRRMAVKREDWLPPEYIRLVAACSDAGNDNRWINTGLRLDGEHEYTVKYCNPGYSNVNATVPVFGGGYSKTDTTFAIWSGTASTGGFSASFGKAQADSETGYQGGADVTKWHVIKADCKTHSLYCDGQLIGTSSKSYFTNLSTKDYKMVLFGNWRQTTNSTKPNSYGRGAIAYFQVRKNGILIRDMVPVLKDATMEVQTGTTGFWDRCGTLSPATGTPFYPFQGSAGRNWALTRWNYVPDAFRRVSYIECTTGENRMYGDALAGQTSVEVEYYMPYQAGECALCGFSAGVEFYPSNGDGRWKIGLWDNNDHTYVYGNGTFFGHHTVKIEGYTCSVDGNVITDGLGGHGMWFNGRPWYIFGKGAYGSESPKYAPAGTRIYKFITRESPSTSWRAGEPEITGLYVPVVRKEDGVIGFYNYEDNNLVENSRYNYAFKAGVH